MTENIVDQLLSALVEKDDQRGRSTQTRIGPSEMGGCARAIWYRLNSYNGGNKTLRLSAIMGTAIHDAIEKAFAGRDGYLTEVELDYGGVMGHVDLIDLKNGVIWDWKTTSKASIGYFPSQQQIAQVQIYGYLARELGYDIKQVGLVAIPRDGNEEDIVTWVGDLSVELAVSTLDRAFKIGEMADAPAPEKEKQFCEKYCKFYDLCGGKTGSPEEDNLITDIEVDSALRRYIELQDISKTVTGEMDGIKKILDGSSGVTTDGLSLKWTQVGGRSAIDEGEVEKLLGFVPKKTGSPYWRMNVGKPKGFGGS